MLGKLQGVALHLDIADSVTWRWTTDGNFTSATAYAAQFTGGTQTNYIDYICLIDVPMLQDLRMACGSGPLLHCRRSGQEEMADVLTMTHVFSAGRHHSLKLRSTCSAFAL